MIDVAYSSVHQAFQLALAAQEENCLRHFHCSIYDAKGKWGGLLSRVLSPGALHSRKVQGLDVSHVVEHPWPLMRKMASDWLHRGDAGDWLAANDAFDKAVAVNLMRSPVKAFIGTETCDLHCLRACKDAGTVRIHDCPQLHPHFLEKVMREASERSGVRWLGTGEKPEMQRRKLDEYALAEHLLLYSDVHRRSFEEAGFLPGQLYQSPLWVDTDFWRVQGRQKDEAIKSVRFLFVGSVSLRKGIPFLIEALKLLQRSCALTLVGPSSSEVHIPPVVGGCSITLTGPMSKAGLRDTYAAHDVFVLPSVADSFGFVALEAMACGLPVILTDNCGAPVPASEWRVPAMDPAALARRMAWYLDDPSRISVDRALAEKFAGGFRPDVYRQGIRRLLRQLNVCGKKQAFA